MKVSVLLPGNSANSVCLTSEKGKVARQQQIVRQVGVRGNLQLLCNCSKAARTGNYKRKPLPDNGALMFIHWGLSDRAEKRLRMYIDQRLKTQAQARAHSKWLAFRGK